jgi:hypothetical protein
VHIETVEIGRPGASVAALFQAALQLGKETKPAPEVKIRRDQIPLQEVAVLIYGADAETRLIEQLDLSRISPPNVMYQPVRPSEMYFKWSSQSLRCEGSESVDQSSSYRIN